MDKEHTHEFSRRHLWWQLSLLLLATVISVYVGMTFDEKLDPLIPEILPKPSVFNHRASGLSALSEIASQSGLKCQPWEASYRDLDKVKGILVIVQPLQSLSTFEVDDILKWVKQGNHLVYFDQFGFAEAQRILKKLSVAYQQGHMATNQVLAPEQADEEYTHVEQITVSGKARLKGGRPLFKDKDGAFFTAVTYGKGRILLGTPTEFCANSSLQDKENFDNFQFLVNWLRTADGSVFFDEKCHGYSNASNLCVFLMRNAPGLIFFQLMLVLVVGIVSGAQRFGQVKEIDNRRQMSNLQYVNGLANAYERAGANLAALEIIAQDFKSNLCKRLGISPYASTGEIEEVWQSHLGQAGSGKDSSNLQRFLADYERALGLKKLSAHEFDQLVHKCDELSKEVRAAFPARGKQ
jgi:hypothetical protein